MRLFRTLLVAGALATIAAAGLGAVEMLHQLNARLRLEEAVIIPVGGIASQMALNGAARQLIDGRTPFLPRQDEKVRGEEFDRRKIVAPALRIGIAIQGAVQAGEKFAGRGRKGRRIFRVLQGAGRARASAGPCGARDG